MNVRYLALAKSDVRVVCDGGAIDWSVLGDIQVPVAITDAAGVAVVQASITMKISPGK
jgi:hypothetical protein